MVLRLVLGTIYTAMGIGQLASMGEMPAILGAYGLVQGAAAAMLAVLLHRPGVGVHGRCGWCGACRRCRHSPGSCR
ncbi:hypothetical protein [Streptomyces regalis]|nr:hypothetical protein [Streptomyces regalis]